MPNYHVVSADRFRDLIMADVSGDDEQAALRALPLNVQVPSGGVYLIKKGDVGPRYIPDNADPDDQIVVVDTAAAPSVALPTAAKR
jgi:hypothetical protein